MNPNGIKKSRTPPLEARSITARSFHGDQPFQDWRAGPTTSGEAPAENDPQLLTWPEYVKQYHDGAEIEFLSKTQCLALIRKFEAHVKEWKRHALSNEFTKPPHTATDGAQREREITAAANRAIAATYPLMREKRALTQAQRAVHDASHAENNARADHQAHIDGLLNLARQYTMSAAEVEEQRQSMARGLQSISRRETVKLQDRDVDPSTHNEVFSDIIIDDFIAEKCTLTGYYDSQDVSDWISQKDLFAAFNSWCARAGMLEWTSDRLGRAFGRAASRSDGQPEGKSFCRRWREKKGYAGLSIAPTIAANPPASEAVTSNNADGTLKETVKLCLAEIEAEKDQARLARIIDTGAISADKITCDKITPRVIDLGELQLHRIAGRIMRASVTMRVKSVQDFLRLIVKDLKWFTKSG